VAVTPGDCTLAKRAVVHPRALIHLCGGLAHDPPGDRSAHTVRPCTCVR
jgi:hypothetical protein